METENTAVHDRRRRLDPGVCKVFVHGFLDHLRALGHSPTTVQFYSGSVRHFVAWVGRSNIALAHVDDEVVRQFATHQCQCLGVRRGERLGADYVNKVRRFVRFLETCGVVPAAPKPTAIVIDERIAEFQVWLKRHRGVAEPTVDQRGRLLMQLLPALGNDPARYTAALVREAFINYCRSAASRHYPRIMATALRGYLRFLAARGDCPADLACAIPTTKHWRLSALPRYLPAGDVERLIASCEVSRPGGLRDRAILLLLARLGLRAKDISALHLEDIEWDEGALRVRGKGRRVVRLPLPQDAGDALLEYVMYARPAAAATDIVFLRLLPPYTPFTRSRSVSCVVDRALDRAGIMHAPSRGTNLLRHSAATAMLRGGATLEAIGTVLRHRSIDTTAHYAKVDLGMLGSIAQPWTVVETAACHDRADMARLFRIAQPWPGDVSC